jgi:hypothetical protein
MTRGMLARRAVALFAAASSLALIPLAVPASAHSAAFPKVFIAVLRGANEVPAADPDGVALAAATVNPSSGEICYLLAQKNLQGDVILAHIHRGAAGVNGPVVVPLDAPVDGVSHNCVDVDPALAADIADNPRDFYFNIHTTVFKGGAIRAQLR